MKHKIKFFVCGICAAFLTTAYACSNASALQIDSPNNDPNNKGDVTVYITNTTRTFDLTSKSVDFSTKDNMSPSSISINRQIRYQTIDGFGAAITGSTAYNLSLMPTEKRKKFLTETFSPNIYGFSYIRISIGCSDFSLSDYTCCDTKGIENFALTSEENNYVIPILKEILNINPDLKIMGTPWTCPRWMKVKDLSTKEPYNSWTGGQLNPDYYQDYATYFVKWIQAFEKQGIHIYSITPQNEPLNRGNSASLYMGWEEERDFVKTALGPALEKAGLSVKIYAFDHNYNYDDNTDQKKYPLKIYEDEEAGRYFTGAAYHNYGGNRDELNKIHAAAPQKQLIFSEASIGEWNNGRDLSKSLLRDMEELALGTVNNWCVGAIVWNLMLDNDQGPHGGEGACSTCYGAVDVNNSDYSTVTRNSHYYVMAHMGAVVKPGATRIQASGYTKKGLTYAAFENTDGTYAFVAANNNSETLNLTIDDGAHHFSYSIPGNAVISYRWRK